MKKVYQTKFGCPNGNCLPACLASIFDLDLEKIPVWSGSNWWNEFTEWCVENLGLQPINIDVKNCFIQPKGYYIINGESKNGNYWHSVVAKNGKVIHDPHPKTVLKNQKTLTFFLKIIDDQKITQKDG